LLSVARARVTEDALARAVERGVSQFVVLTFAPVDFIAARPAGSGVVFDYSVARESLGWRQRLALSMLEKRVAAAGEPFRTFFSPAALRQRLLESGFTTIEGLNGDDLNVRYFANRTGRLHVTGGLGRLVTATT
jgi:O-methyltransferase involved in polyketide biosynthesis